MPNDPIMDAMPLWMRAVAALCMLVFAWFTSAKIDQAEPVEPEVFGDQGALREYMEDDWQWPAR